MRLILTRHPGTKENKQGIIQGKEHGTIEKDGIKQIKKFIKRIKKEKIDKIISSDAKRCKVMTKEILKKIKVPYEFAGLINEKDYGRFTGRKNTEVDSSVLEGKTIETKKYPGGENLKNIKKRAEKFLNKIIEYENPNKRILIISHSIFLQIFIGIILNLSLKNSRYKININHCSVSIIDIIKKDSDLEFKLKTLNETNFLR